MSIYFDQTQSLFNCGISTRVKQLEDEIEALKAKHVKPDFKPDLVKYVVTEAVRDGICRWDSCAPEYANLCLTYCGETGKLKSAIRILK